MNRMEKVKKFTAEKMPLFFIEEHIKTVVKWALKLCEYYPEADKEVVEAAAWLHDMGHSSAGKGACTFGFGVSKNIHHTEGAKIAKEFLKTTGFSEVKIEKIINCILSHRTRAPPEPKSIEEKIVASADNLAHFEHFETLAGHLKSREEAVKKLERDINAPFMLPEALEYAEKRFAEIMV